MINYRPTLKEKLQVIGLPVFYEVFLTKDTELPCISFIEADNIASSVGDTMGYSDVYYNVKVWAKEVKTLSETSVRIDEIMRELGFKRTGSTELWLDTIGQLQLRYQGLALERFSKGEL